MIPEAYIIQWSQHVPWRTFAQVEQDLIISRTLVSIFTDRFLSSRLSFRGGTALHKLNFSPQVRYSEDIDLVQLKAGPIKPIAIRIKEVLSPWLGDTTSTKLTQRSFKRYYKFKSEIQPVQSMKLKIEINTTEHFSVYGNINVPFQIENGWFDGRCPIPTYQLEELLGTKMRALYQRSKGRDLFDLDYALRTRKKLDREKIVRCFCEYLQFSAHHIPTSTQMKQNLEDKLNKPDFVLDTTGLLRPAVKWNIQQAYDQFSEVIDLLDDVRKDFIN